MRFLNTLTILALVFSSGCNSRGSVNIDATPLDTASHSAAPDTGARKAEASAASFLPLYKDTVLGLQEILKSAYSYSGCEGVYAIDTARLDRSQFLFRTDLVNHFAEIQVDNQNIYLVEDTAKTKSAGSDQDYTQIFEGGSYKAVIHLHQVRQYDEGGRYQGTLEVEKDDRKTIIPIIGDSGC